MRDALHAALASALEAVVEAARSAREGATHEESRAEGDKDMRSTEQSYLARGQAMRAEELAEQLQRFELTPLPAFGPGDPIRAGALVRLAIEDDERVVLIVAQGGGTALEVDGVGVTVVTPSSPLGRALLGRREGDDFELEIRGRRREHVIQEIA